jgi:hypothetical protein
VRPSGRYFVREPSKVPEKIRSAYGRDSARLKLVPLIPFSLPVLARRTMISGTPPPIAFIHSDNLGNSSKPGPALNSLRGQHS